MSNKTIQLADAISAFVKTHQQVFQQSGRSFYNCVYLKNYQEGSARPNPDPEVYLVREDTPKELIPDLAKFLVEHELMNHESYLKLLFKIVLNELKELPDKFGSVHEILLRNWFGNDAYLLSDQVYGQLAQMKLIDVQNPLDRTKYWCKLNEAGEWHLKEFYTDLYSEENPRPMFSLDERLRSFENEYPEYFRKIGKRLEDYVGNQIFKTPNPAEPYVITSKMEWSIKEGTPEKLIPSIKKFINKTYGEIFKI